jgi:hypothetical protein
MARLEAARLNINSAVRDAFMGMVSAAVGKVDLLASQ